MGPFVILHVALVGFFICAAMYSAGSWWLARDDRTVLVFAVQCLLCAAVTVCFVVIAEATDPATADAALSGRLVAGMLYMAVTALLIARITNVRARPYVAFVGAYAVVISSLHLLVQPSQGHALSLAHVTLAWGEVIAVPAWSTIPWWFVPSYAVVLSVHVFGLFGASRLIRRDRVGGGLVGLASASGLATSFGALAVDVLRLPLPYWGNIPFAFWAILIAVQLSREHAALRQRQAEGEQRLRGIFDHTLHYMGLLDASGILLDANRPVLQAAGLQADAVLGRPFWETPVWAHSEQLQERVRLAVSAAAAGETVRFETRHPQPDGGTRIVDFSLKPIRDERGKVVLLIPEGRDITELGHAHSALRESEQRFRTLIDGLDVGVLLQDAENRVVISNPAAARLVGVAEERWRGATSRNPQLDLIREDGSPYPADQVPSVAAARTRQPVRNAIIGVPNRQTGMRTWLQVSATPHLREDGSLQHVLVTFVDVTDRKRAEDAVRSSSRRLALAISATSDAVWEWNHQTGEAYYSPRWFEMLGMPEGPMTIDTWKSHCHPDDLEPALSHVESALASERGSGYEVEFRMRRADGSWAWILGRGKVVEWDGDGRPLLVAGTSTDITLRKEAETRRHELDVQFAQAQRMESMGRLAGGIAHDFNNLLTIINGYTELLLNSSTLDTGSRQMLDDVHAAGERAAALTRQLLTFSRHRVLDPDIVDLNVVVSDTERMLERLIGEHIRLRTTLANVPLWTRADQGQLGQVVVNLVVNARDAMPEGGCLTVETALVTLDADGAAEISRDALPGRYAVLLVTDTGVGIPEELRQLVFEPFFTTKGVGHGTGLGLATVHGIVRQCGGFLSVASRPGLGSTFRVYLPTVASVEPCQDCEAARSPLVAGSRTVLMVEDEVGVRSVARLMLQRMGFEVLVAEDAEAALRLVDAYMDPIDLLVTDVIMPGLNGRQLAEQLVARRPGLRVLYMSGYTDDAVVQQVVLNEDAAYLQKPFDADTLARKVRQALDMAPPAPGT
jgi:two-component system, cell cycle sensor histidine kinase and response regulator CckA